MLQPGSLQHRLHWSSRPLHELDICEVEVEALNEHVLFFKAPAKRKVTPTAWDDALNDLSDGDDLVPPPDGAEDAQDEPVLELEQSTDIVEDEGRGLDDAASAVWSEESFGNDLEEPLDVPPAVVDGGDDVVCQPCGGDGSPIGDAICSLCFSSSTSFKYN